MNFTGIPHLTDFLSDHNLRFGAHVFRIRQRMGAQQVEIANRARLSTGYFSELENGKRPAPPYATAVRVVRALCVSEEEFNFLVALANAERCADTVDSQLAPDVRRLLACIRAATPRLDKPAIERLFNQVAREVHP